MSEEKTLVALKALREPFVDGQMSYKPVPTRAQTDAMKADYKLGIRCSKCGGWHHKDAEHLAYVGHAALTDRLLSVDPLWNWEPVSFDDNGLPLMTGGGMWIKLTICGHTRLGYGDAPGKSGGDAVKEIIGDALRNAAMRFGAALDLWHKGDLHAAGAQELEPLVLSSDELMAQQKIMYAAKNLNELKKVFQAAQKLTDDAHQLEIIVTTKDARKAELEKPAEQNPFDGAQS